jgi:hypothetical protein
MEKAYLNTSELAARWGQCPEAIRRSVRRGLLRAVQLPGRRRLLVPMSAILELEKPFVPRFARSE